MIIKKVILGLFALTLLDGVMLAKTKVQTLYDISEPFTIGLGKGQGEAPPAGTDKFLLETGDAFLLESDDKILME